MLFDASTHVVMLTTAVVGTIVLGMSMRRQQTWSTVLIWVVPICLILSATDALLGVLSGPFPSVRMDGENSDWLRFGFCFLALVFPCEIVCQLAVNWMTDRGTVRVPAREAERPKSTAAPSPSPETQ